MDRVKKMANAHGFTIEDDIMGQARDLLAFNAIKALEVLSKDVHSFESYRRDADVRCIMQCAAVLQIATNL